MAGEHFASAGVGRRCCASRPFGLIPALRCAAIGLIAGLAPALAGCGGAARETQDFPARQITLVVPFSPGGGTDTYARIFKQAIEQEDLLPVPLVVINQGGAGGTIGSRRVKDADPDGYTMMVLHDAILTAKLAGQVDYSHDAFVPIAATSEVGMVIAVRKNADYRSLDDLMQAAAAQPDTVRFGANRGALTHFAGLQLESLAPGAKFRYAQIGGGAERFANLKAGHIDVTGFSIEEFVRFRGDELSGLCFFGEQRHPAAPDVPTAQEQGYDLVNRNTFYWWFPKEVPRERIRYMEDVLRKAVASPHVVKSLTDIHCEPIFLKGRPLLQRLQASEAELARVSAGVDNPIPWLPGALLAFASLCGALSVVDWVLIRRRHRPLVESPDAAPNDRPSDGGTDDDAAARPRLDLAALSAASVVGYTIALAAGVNFRIATFLFVLVLGAVLSPRNGRAFALAAASALLVALGVYYLFTGFFVIDLPSG